MDLASATFWMLDDAATLVNYDTIRGTISNIFGGVIRGGIVENLGLMTTDQAGAQLVSLTALHNAVAAEVTAVTGTVYLFGTVDNDGLIGAYGQRISFSEQNNFGTATNFAGGQLRGGTWEMLAGGSITLNGGGLLRELLDGAQVTLGAGTSFAARQDDDSVVAIEQSLRIVGADAALRLEAGRSFAAIGPLDLAGVLTLSGGVLSTDELTLKVGGSLSGDGQVEATSAIAGHVVARGGPGSTGELTFVGDTEFSGRAAADGAASLTYAASHAPSAALFDGAILHPAEPLHPVGACLV